MSAGAAGAAVPVAAPADLTPWRRAALWLALLAGIGFAGAVGAGADASATSVLWLPGLAFAGLVAAGAGRNAPRGPSVRLAAGLVWAAVLAALAIPVAGALAGALSEAAGDPRPDVWATALGGGAAALAWARPRRIGPVAAALLAALGLRVLGGGAAGWIVAGGALGAAATLAVLSHLARRGVLPAPGGVGAAGRRWTLAPVPGGGAGTGRIALGLLLATAAALALFLAFPGVDLFVSGLFYRDGAGFHLAGAPKLEEIRGVFEFLIRAMPVVALALLLHALRTPARPAVPARIWAFVFLAFLLGPGLLANAVLKENWGRARPADIVAFGGKADFTLPFEIADQCASNCSFVSGEGSGIAMAAIVIGALAWPWLRSRPLAVVLLAAPAAFGILLRVAKGRHFASDTVFAVLLMALVALVLYRWLGIGRLRERLTVAALLDDVAGLVAYALPGARPSLWRDLGRILAAAGAGVTELARQGRAMAAKEPPR